MFLQHRDVENHKEPNGKTMDLMAQTLVKKKRPICHGLCRGEWAFTSANFSSQREIATGDEW